MKISERALNLLADLGYDPQFGARPMKRVLQREIINELSKLLLGSEYVAGDTIYVDTSNKKLTFSHEAYDEAAIAKEIAEKEAAQTEAKKERRKTRRSRSRKKNIEDLEKANKEVMDAVKDIEGEKGKE